MAYPLDLTVALTGASQSQLYEWNKKGLLHPELCDDRREGFLWSFRDLIALRTFVKLRTDHSLQAIRKAMSNLRELNLTEHPASYTLVSDGDSVFLVEDEGAEATDLLKHNGQKIISNLDDIFRGFQHPNRVGEVVNFLSPRPKLEVNEHRLGGFPTIRGTRVAFDSVANLVADGSVPIESIGDFYPDVTAEDARDALSFMEQVEAKRGWA
ncbi:DUF433 domain-containing protein [Corynebacterium sp. H127]|uniref:DUF433 domain-containing protein n=1 Tax=Corynebacterium sp. H127 TaxID=3133418 RepID=UPI0030B56B62